ARLPQTCQRGAREWCVGLLAGQIDDRRRQVAETDGLLHYLRRRSSARRDEEKRNVNLGLGEALAVAQNASRLAETLPVVRGDDQPGLSQSTAALQVVDQFTDLFIEVGDAVVIGIGGECHTLG